MPAWGGLLQDAVMEISAMRKRMRAAIWAAAPVLLWLCTSATPVHGQGSDFYLHDGDTVVFYGDSITEQGLYTAVVDLYTRTRYPGMKVRFYTAGIGGDRVTGGFAGGVDERLQRDVFPHQPTVVTIMLGMNDGGYKALSEDSIASYTKGYEHILQSIRQTLPHARITLLGTSPYDEVTRPELVPGGYNRALLQLAAINRQLAQKYDALYVDLNQPVVDALTRAKAMNVTATEMMIPDRIHPGSVLHWVMAAAILKGWHGPSEVTSVSLDAVALQPTGTAGASVTGVAKDGTGLTWQELDRALPLPLNTEVTDFDFILKSSDVEQSLNQEPLRVSGLHDGRYLLLIDGKSVGTATAQEWRTGVNLAQWKTPMRDQAQSAMYLIRDYEYTQLVHTRLLVRDRDAHLPSAAGDAELDKFQDLENDLITAAVQPKPHTFQLQVVP